jgi:hypothetical protein
LRRAREPREKQRFIAPHRLDQGGPGPVRARGDTADERRGLEGYARRQRPHDDEPLPRLEVQRDPDGKLSVRFELLLVGIGGGHD